MPSKIDSKQFVLQMMMLILLFASLLGGAWAVWKVITTISPQVAAAIIAGGATVLVSVFSVLWSKRVERRREIEQEQRRQKIPVYEDFIKFLFRILMADKLGEEKVSEEEMMKFVSGFAQKIIVWGSDEVLHRYALFRRMAHDASGLETVVAVESLLYAIRADVGHNNKNLKTGDLLSIFINDIEAFLGQTKH